MPANSSQRGQAIIVLIIALVIVASFLFVGGFKFKPSKYAVADPTRFSDSEVIPVTPSSKKENIQLEPLRFCKRVEGDSPTCYPHNAGYCCPNDAWAKVRCENQKCVGAIHEGGGSFVNVMAEKAGMSACDWMENPVNYPGHQGFPVHEWCGGCELDSAFLCWGKPVILLYPTRPTLVDVEVVTSGEIFISDPLYPSGGWKKVLANPDGSLVYQDKPYKELFYESKVKNYGMPKSGLVFKTSDIEDKLPKLLYDLGLNYNETEIPEFMDFWLPKLKDLNSKYIFVGLIPEDVKEKNDKVIINPEPDTRIELIVYFKPLDKPIDVDSLRVGKRPERYGFTMVEWGGTIDK